MTINHDTKVVNIIHLSGLIPLFFHPDHTVCRSVARAVFDSGCNVLEFTNRGVEALDAFKDMVGFVRQQYPDAIVGAGSIIDAAAATEFLELGADFIVGPGFDKEVSELCNKNNVLYIPGCGTVTEIMTATKSGAKLIKLFPAGALGGPDFVKAIKGPMPWLKVIPTGGVQATEESLNDWFSAGVVAVGLGSDLISKNQIARADYSGMQQNLQNLLAAVRKYRGKVASK